MKVRFETGVDEQCSIPHRTSADVPRLPVETALCGPIPKVSSGLSSGSRVSCVLRLCGILVDLDLCGIIKSSSVLETLGLTARPMLLILLAPLWYHQLPGVKVKTFRIRDKIKKKNASAASTTPQVRMLKYTPTCRFGAACLPACLPAL